MNTGKEVRGAGAGSDKKLRHELMEKLNEFVRQLCNFSEVDLAGAIYFYILVVHVEAE